jgi:two-component system, cell cycle sensor histidine kinase and response regulator CckA
MYPIASYSHGDATRDAAPIKEHLGEPEANLFGVVVTDMKRILECNDYVLRLLGYTREDLAAGRLNRNTMIAPASQAKIDESLHILLEKGACPPIEIELKRRDGSLVPVLRACTLIRLEPSPAIMIHVVDLSEQRRAEQQARRAQKLESIGRLAGGVAHDFNNLLTVIGGGAEMVLAELGEDHPLRETLEEMATAARKATGLTRLLLTVGRRSAVQPRVVRLNDLLRRMEMTIRNLIGAEIQLVLSLHQNTGSLRIDPEQLEQAIMNLAANARDAMPTGGRLIIETAPLMAGAAHGVGLAPGPCVTLTIRDEGIGLSQTAMEHLFEPFFTTKEQGMGTGLGLAAVYGTVQQAGGTIEVLGNPGRGAAFRMIFPSVQTVAEPVPAQARRPQVRGSETILLAEDEAGVRKFVQRMLTRSGYTVLEAGNGRDALELARRHSGEIHLLLTDMLMPVMGGKELAWRFHDIRPGVPVVCMSGYSGEHMPHCPISLQKPFSGEALLRIVRETLDTLQRPEDTPATAAISA